jgi:hypothetical protein
MGRVSMSSDAHVLVGSQDWRASRVREWLLLLLRFTITREPKDEAAVLTMADEN